MMKYKRKESGGEKHSATIKNMRCNSCNEEFSSLMNGLCQSCNSYFKNGGIINPLPEPGRIERDYRGYVICHICGKSFKKLGAHTHGKHGITIKDYKEMFGLCNNARTTEVDYSQRMHDYAYQYNMQEQLRITGVNTRTRPGDTHLRLGKRVRLQECLEKRARSVNRRNRT